jgi:hypothetical protein
VGHGNRAAPGRRRQRQMRRFATSRTRRRFCPVRRPTGPKKRYLPAKRTGSPHVTGVFLSFELRRVPNERTKPSSQFASRARALGERSGGGQSGVCGQRGTQERLLQASKGKNSTIGPGKSLAIQPHRRYSTPKALHLIVEDAEFYFGICSKPPGAELRASKKVGNHVLFLRARSSML